jgi:hypothetical protein
VRTLTANSSMPLTRACARRFSTGSSRHDFALGPPFSAPAVSPVAPCPKGLVGQQSPGVAETPRRQAFHAMCSWQQRMTV